MAGHPASHPLSHRLVPLNLCDPRLETAQPTKLMIEESLSGSSHQCRRMDNGSLLDDARPPPTARIISLSHMWSSSPAASGIGGLSDIRLIGSRARDRGPPSAKVTAEAARDWRLTRSPSFVKVPHTAQRIRSLYQCAVVRTVEGANSCRAYAPTGCRESMSPRRT